ncbi:DUF6884 domain-containing protein [Kineosporia sp. A_224]|uniref:DUF6884 domain-containing protein n=1 Tax=Kineosporia sp. A_224 TaxID=1962180 RepID=UPI0018E94431|nr:DUF6884 domain-containing protein [Kineosporia sp. A_224]
MAAHLPTWQLVLDAAHRLGSGGRTFTRDALVREVHRLDPARGDSTIGPVIQGMTVNATGGPKSPGGTPLHRVDRGLYRLTVTSAPIEVEAAAQIAVPATTSQTHSADIALIGCVKTKLDHSAPARDLYVSPLFRQRRRYAEASGLPWFVLSSRWGLVAPDEVIATYDLYLGAQPRSYRTAWGAFVVEQLAAAVGPLADRHVEVHAGDHYRSALDAPLRSHAAVPTNPVPPAGVGETIAWYTSVLGAGPASDVAGWDLVDDETTADDDVEAPERDQGPFTRESPPANPAEAARLVAVLTDPAHRMTPGALLAAGRSQLSGPGLYSWWVDADGAADLTRGAGLPVHEGLIYAGLAGATRWPSGKRSTNTLWSRLAGMHLGGRAELSTFRRTLAGLLRGPLAMTSEDDARLTEWIHAHLQVAPVVVEDADTLGRLEDDVLAELDPPLNLQGMPRTALRARISELRRARDR